MAQLRLFWEDQSGQEMIEWTVVAVVLLAATVIAVRVLQKALVGAFCSVLKNIADVDSGFVCQYQP